MKKDLLREAEEMADSLGLRHLHHRFIIRFARFVDDMMFAEEYEHASHFIFLTSDDFYRWKEKISKFIEENDYPTISEWLSFYLEYLKEKFREKVTEVENEL